MKPLVNEDGTRLSLSAPAQRIVSLVPSITENLILFGRSPVGRTSFCIEPRDRVRSIPVVGGTKNPKLEKIESLNPDLVIANKEENREEDVTGLRSRGLHVWVNYPTRVVEVVPFMKDLAMLSGTENLAMSTIEDTAHAIEKIQKEKFPRAVRMAALIWKDPWMVAGSSNYMSDLMEFAGGENVFLTLGRYPEVTEQQIVSSKPEILLLPSEPFSFGEKHRVYWKERLPKTRVELISGEDVTWFGPRTARGLQEVRRLTCLSVSG